jgi:hypothetical protein
MLLSQSAPQHLLMWVICSGFSRSQRRSHSKARGAPLLAAGPTANGYARPGTDSRISQRNSAADTRKARLTGSRHKSAELRSRVLVLQFCTARPHFHSNGSAIKREHSPQPNRMCCNPLPVALPVRSAPTLHGSCSWITSLSQSAAERRSRPLPADPGSSPESRRCRTGRSAHAAASGCEPRATAQSAARSRFEGDATA